MTIAVVVAAAVGLLVVLVLSALTVIPEYERVVFVQLGHLRRRKGVSPWSS